MRKDKGFSLLGTLTLLMLAAIMLHVMVMSQISTMKYRKKRFKIIQTKVEVFNKSVKEIKLKRTDRVKE